MSRERKKLESRKESYEEKIDEKGGGSNQGKRSPAQQLHPEMGKERRF